MFKKYALTTYMKNKVGYIIMAYLSLFCYGMLDNIRGPAYPSILNAFNLSLSKGSLFFAVSSLAGLPVLIFGNKWLRYFGELYGQRIFLFLMSLGIFGIGFSGYIQSSFLVLIISSVFLGFGFGGTTISSNILIANAGFENNNRRLFSGMHAMYGLSSIIAPVLYSMAIFSGYTWSNLFILLSLFPIIALILTFKSTRIPHVQGSSSKPENTKYHKILLIASMLSLYVAGEICISSRLVLYITKVKNINSADASVYLTLFFIMLFAGRFLFSIIHPKWSNYRLMMISNISSLILIILGIFVYPVFLSLSAFTMSYFFPYGMDWISIKFRENKGYMITVVMTFVSIFLFLMHTIVGILSNNFGIKAGMFSSAIFLLLSTILLFYLKLDFEIKKA